METTIAAIYLDKKGFFKSNLKIIPKNEKKEEINTNIFNLDWTNNSNYDIYNNFIHNNIIIPNLGDNQMDPTKVIIPTQNLLQEIIQFHYGVQTLKFKYIELENFKNFKNEIENELLFRTEIYVFDILFSYSDQKTKTDSQKIAVEKGLKICENISKIYTEKLQENNYKKNNKIFKNSKHNIIQLPDDKNEFLKIFKSLELKK